MAGNKLNLDLFSEKVALHDAFKDASKAKTKDAVRFIFSTILETVKDGDEVLIPGFGKFSKFTSSTTNKSKLKFNNASAVKAALNQ